MSCKFSNCSRSVKRLGSIVVASTIALALAGAAQAATDLDQAKSDYSRMQSVVNQNSSGHFQQKDWNSRIALSGIVNVDGKSSELNVKDAQSNNTLALNNANLFIDANVNDWTNIHLNLANLTDSYADTYNYPDKWTNTLSIPEAYAVIADASRSHFFLKVGRMNMPFGDYQANPILSLPTDFLTKLNASGIEGGFVLPVGFYASVFSYKGTPKALDLPSRVNSSGINLGYAYSDSDLSAKVGLSVINNFADVDFVREMLANNYLGKEALGVATNASVNFDQFDASLKYVSTADKTPLQGVLFQDAAGNFVISDSIVHPRAYGVEFGYTFPVADHQSRFSVGFDQTKNISWFLPKEVVHAGYVFNAYKWLDVGAVVFQNTYDLKINNKSLKQLGSVIRFGAKFA